MSNRTRTVIFALVLCGYAAFTGIPQTNAQEKKPEKITESPSVAGSSAQGTESVSQDNQLAVQTAAATVNGKDEATKKSNPMDRSKATKAVSGALKSPSNPLRLPRYFAGLVDEEQREAIYVIQLDFRTKIVELEEELARVRQDEQSELEKLLTDSQRKLLVKKRLQAAESASGKKAADKDKPDASSENS